MKFYSPPYEFEAVQWKGDNLEEVQAFCGTRTALHYDGQLQIFNPIGTYLIPSEKNEGATGEVWDDEARVWRPVNTGDWIVPQEDGFVPCTDEWLHVNKVELSPDMEALLVEQNRPKSFEEELSSVLNRHSKENVSGTPDFILAEYLTGCLYVYNKTVVHRTNWRGESVELPALQRLHEQPEEDSPEDRQDQYHEAMSDPKLFAPHPSNLDALKDEPQKEGLFGRYQKKGLSDNGE